MPLDLGRAVWVQVDHQVGRRRFAENRGVQCSNLKVRASKIRSRDARLAAWYVGEAWTRFRSP